MGIYRFSLERFGNGQWVCSVEFNAYLSDQFTAQSIFGGGYVSRWPWLAFFKAWIGARASKRQIEKSHALERKAKGWA